MGEWSAAFYEKVLLHIGLDFRLRRMHEVQTIVTDVRGVCPSVCLSRGSTRLPAFSVAGPTVKNSLPDELREETENTF